MARLRLLERLPLGGHVAPNRLMFGPHVTNLGQGREISERHVAYYARRAAGGAGMVVVETASVHPSDWPYERAPLAERCGPGWQRVAAACHAGGSLAIASIGHFGGQGSSAYSQAELWAPSAVPEVNTREVPKVMETEDIAAVVEGFARAARTAAASGMDGVEVNAGQHSLVRQFLSGLTNLRQDSYGSDRTRFAAQVLAAVRQAAGKSIVGLRLSCDELAPWAGITPDAAVEIASALEALVDYVVVVRGSIYSVAATRPDSHTPPGFNIELARRIREALPEGVVVVAQGSIVDAEMAEGCLAGGAADAVEMTRAQIADPDLGAKLASGAAARVRPCILCNQRCMVLDPRNPIVSCVAEPSAGHETEDEPVEPAGYAHQKPGLLVVGGGPAGLEAARVAAMRGHRVKLVERQPRSGGRLRTAAAVPGRERLAALARWLEAECEALGVEVETGREVAALELDAHAGPVLLATGSLDGAPAEGLVSAASALEPGGGLPPGPAVVWDPVGGPVGVGVAEALAADREVALVTPDLLAGSQLSVSGDLVDCNRRLRQSGVRIVKHSTLREVRPGTAVVADLYSDAVEEIPAGLVVDAGPRLPDDRLWRERPSIPRAGDAVAPRTIYEAVLEGRRLALALEP